MSEATATKPSVSTTFNVMLKGKKLDPIVIDVPAGTKPKEALALARATMGPDADPAIKVRKAHKVKGAGRPKGAKGKKSKTTTAASAAPAMGAAAAFFFGLYDYLSSKLG